MARELIRRLVKGFAANAVSQGVTVFFQFVTIPILIAVWGIGRYEEWLVLSAIPASLALTDLGFGTAAANEMTMRVGREDRDGALKVFQTVWTAVTCLSILMLVVVTTLTIALPLNQILRIDEIDAQSVQVIVLCLVAQVVAQQQRVVINAGYRCDGLYARGVMASNLTRLAAFLGGIGALVVNQSVVAYAAASSAFVIAGTVMMAIDLNRRRPWIAHGIRRFSATLLKPLTAPALSFLAYSLGLGLSLQGMLMVIHFQGTEAAVVAFDTMRKVSRVLIQAAAVISAPVGVELSSALGRKDKTLSKGLHRNLGQTVALVTVVLFLILFFVSEPLIGALSRQKVAFDSHLLLVLLAAAGVQNFWSPGATVLSAVNKNVSMTTMILVTAGAALTATWILIPVWGILSAAYSLLAAQLVVLVWVEKRACRLLEIDFGSWAKSFARFDVLNQMLLQLRK